jgi:fructokinase
VSYDDAIATHVAGDAVAGVEAGGTKVVCAIGTGPNDLRATVTLATAAPAETLARVLAFIRHHGPVAAVGIGSFGPLDLESGRITTTPKPGWANTDLRRAFSALGVPVAIDTDVNAAALAEHRWGAARDVDPFVYVTVGTGIGGGAVVHGRLLHGLVHPEMGHVRIPHDRAIDPFAGTCPFHGDCLEGLASGVAMRARWGAPADTLPRDHPAWDLEAHYLALGFATITAMLSPKRIVVGGGVASADGLLARVRTELLDVLAGYVPAGAIARRMESYVVAPALGGRAGVLGALALAQAAITASCPPA